MAKTAILLPYPEMCDQVLPLLDRFPHIDPLCVEHIRTDQVESRVAQLEQAGCELIIARGLQAIRIRGCTQIPLIEIQVEAQELAILVKALREQIPKDRPVIALLGFANMFTDTSAFDDLFQVSIRKYFVTEQNELEAAAQTALSEGADALIGGETVCAAAQRLSLPASFLRSSPEGLHRALSLASRTAYAIDLEKRDRAEISLMLDSSHSGVLLLTPEGRVRRANQAAYDLLGKSPADLLNRPISEALPDLKKSILTQVLQKHEEAYTTLSDVYHRTIIVNLTPIFVDERMECVQITLDEGQRIQEMDNKLRRDLYQRGFLAQHRFSGLIASAPETQAVVEQARQMAQYPAPVLLFGEPGTGKQILAQCIHNESPLSANAFVPLDCAAWPPERLDAILFGEPGPEAPACLCELAQDGTLYLANVENLSPQAQYKLLNLIQGSWIRGGSHRSQLAKVRVLASASADLESLVRAGQFRGDLYYALSVLTLNLLPLRSRKADIPGWVAHYLEEAKQEYKRYITLTKGAQQLMQAYDWPGNLDQIRSLCHRVVLLTKKSRVDEAFLRQQLEETHPQSAAPSPQPYRSEKAAQIAAALRQFGGNRQKAAEALGISKTTLWRNMKKYGIETSFAYDLDEEK